MQKRYSTLSVPRCLASLPAAERVEGRKLFPFIHDYFTAITAKVCKPRQSVLKLLHDNQNSSHLFPLLPRIMYAPHAGVEISALFVIQAAEESFTRRNFSLSRLF